MSRRLLVLVAAGVAIATVPLAGVPAGASSAAGSTAWQTQLYLPPTAVRQQSSFVAVSAPAADDVWAVGNELATRPPQDRPLVEHWNGRRWAALGGPKVPGARSAMLTGVSALADDDVWLTGEALYGPNLDSGDYVAHWDGVQWDVHQFGVNWIVRHLAVFAPDDVWALGSAGCCPGSASAVHWDGSTWTISPLPAQPTGEPNYSVAPGWATAEDPATREPQLLRYDGTAWVLAPVPALTLPAGAASAYLRDVLQVGTDVWVTVGFAAGDGLAPGLQLWHWDGTSWVLQFSRDNESPSGMTPDGTGGLWILSAGLAPHGQFLHVAGHRLLDRVHPAVVDSRAMQVEDFALLPTTTELFAVGEIISGGMTSAVVASLQP